MSFYQWGYSFVGWFSSTWSLERKAGVYVISCNQTKILDVGESENVRERIEDHERKDCWERQCSGTIYYAVTYISSESERRDLEKKIRNAEIPPCGEI